MRYKTKLLAFALVVGSFLATIVPHSASADCVPLPTQSRVTIKVGLEQPGKYRLWLRQVTPAGSGKTIAVAVNDECGIAVVQNVQKDALDWVGSSAQGQPLVFTLAAGEHSIILAGDQTSIGVDKGLLTTDLACVPVDAGDNCPLPATEAKETSAPPETPKVPEPANRWALPVALASLAAILGVIGIVVWHYVSFMRRIVLPALGLSLPAGRKIKHALSLSTMGHFFNHHRLVMIMCGITLVVCTFLFGLSLAAAKANDSIFEAENGVLSGDARRVDDPAASGGAYVVLGGAPPPHTTSPKQKTSSSGGGGQGTPQNNNGSGGNNGDNGGSGGNNGGGGGDNGDGLLAECPTYPAFPDDKCTGWEHTGVTLENCDGRTDNGYIWESNLTFDKCYFSISLTVYGANITITRSQIHGHVSTHWSNNYDFRGLSLTDVEIEQENLEEVSAGIGGNNYSCLRCNVHHTLSGIHFGDNTTIRDSYTHDFQWRDEAHGAGVATGQDHGSNSSIIHNNIQCNRISGPPICSSALSIYPEDDNGDGITVHNVQVENNLFNATGAYCVYAVSIAGSNINFIGNHFGKKFYSGCAGYGPVTGYGPAGGEWTDNKWDDGSGPVVP